MYFTRYIWVYLRRIYLKSFKKHFKIKKLSKVPLTQIPYALKTYLVIKGKRCRCSDLSNLRELTSDLLNISTVSLKYNLQNKYYLNFSYSYYFTHNLYFFFNYFIVKRKIIKYKRRLRLHNGRYTYSIFAPYLNLTLSLLTETVKYGMRKKKNKKLKNKK